MDDFTVLIKGVIEMFIDTGYKTNEVLGGFWRPVDYMAKVPSAHVTGKEVADAGSAASLSLSKAGLNLSKYMNTEPVVFTSEDGMIRRVAMDKNIDMSM